MYRKIRDYFWWKACKWVFGVKYDYRWQYINDKMMKEWRDGYFAGLRAKEDKKNA